LSENGILVDGNPQLAEIHGYELAEMIGRPVMDFVAPESRALVAKHIREGYGAAYECYGVRKNGSTFPAEVHACMRSWHGKQTRVTALRDLTEVKQAAARLQAQQTELEHAHRLALVSEISAGIIHQIGQPLCAMGANLAVAMAMLKNGPAECHETMEILGEVERDVDNMRDVTTHMRALAHAVQPNHQSVDFNQLLEDALQLLRQEAANCGFQLAVDLGHDLPPVQADVVQLDQVILHLTRNAFEACVECPPDRRTIAITTRVVADVDVELSVCDRGIGITPDAMERMFWPFFTTKADALGIGLRLSRTIVEAHGGRIEAGNNADGFGATFRVILPGNAPRHHANL
jgi:two-component system sensor kinase FixL